jgi:hypothetical protein
LSGTNSKLLREKGITVTHFPDAEYVEAAMLKSLINESEDVWYLRKKGTLRPECAGQMHLKHSRWIKKRFEVGVAVTIAPDSDSEYIY